MRRRLLTEEDWEDETVPHVPEWAREEAGVSQGQAPAQDGSGSRREEHAEGAATEFPAKFSEIREIRPETEDAEEDTTAAMGRRATREELDTQPDSDPADMLWVKNGDRLVGPVTAALLLAGIAAGRVPRESEVLNMRERIWRPLAATLPFADAVRELDVKAGSGSGSRE